MKGVARVLGAWAAFVVAIRVADTVLTKLSEIASAVFNLETSAGSIVFALVLLSCECTAFWWISLIIANSITSTYTQTVAAGSMITGWLAATIIICAMQADNTAAVIFYTITVIASVAAWCLSIVSKKNDFEKETEELRQRLERVEQGNAQYDSKVNSLFGNYNHPVTGQPIRTMSEYLDAIEIQEQRKRAHESDNGRTEAQ